MAFEFLVASFVSYISKREILKTARKIVIVIIKGNLDVMKPRPDC